MNQLSYVGSGSIMYSSTRWGESEVMSELARLGEIPKKFESGYYISERKNTFKISYIVPDNQK